MNTVRQTEIGIPRCPQLTQEHRDSLNQSMEHWWNDYTSWIAQINPRDSSSMRHLYGENWTTSYTIKTILTTLILILGVCGSLICRNTHPEQLELSKLFYYTTLIITSDIAIHIQSLLPPVLYYASLIVGHGLKSVLTFELPEVRFS
jgi:hypothetical protein